MLVVTRKRGQKLILQHEAIGEIVIEPVGWGSKQMRLGVQAQPSVTIVREELLGRGQVTGDRGQSAEKPEPEAA